MKETGKRCKAAWTNSTPPIRLNTAWAHMPHPPHPPHTPHMPHTHAQPPNPKRNQTAGRGARMEHTKTRINIFDQTTSIGAVKFFASCLSLSVFRSVYLSVCLSFSLSLFSSFFFALSLLISYPFFSPQCPFRPAATLIHPPVPHWRVVHPALRGQRCHILERSSRWDGRA